MKPNDILSGEPFKMIENPEHENNVIVHFAPDIALGGYLLRNEEGSDIGLVIQITKTGFRWVHYIANIRFEKFTFFAHCKPEKTFFLNKSPI
jgi:hypothetical protein